MANKQIPYTHPRNLIYLRGTLFLFAPNGHTFKLKRLNDGVEFIKLIQQYLDHDEFPVDVAEGKYLDKWEAINSRYYLHTAYDRLKHRDSQNLVIYRFSFSKPDDHVTQDLPLPI